MGIKCPICAQDITSARGGVYELGQGVRCLKCILERTRKNLQESKVLYDDAYRKMRK
jgi:hypothetical protein